MNELDCKDEERLEEFCMNVLQLDAEDLVLTTVSKIPLRDYSWYIVDLKINGNLTTFMIDTGAQYNVIGLPGFQRLGLHKNKTLA